MPSMTFTRGRQNSTALPFAIEGHLKTVCIVLSLCAATAIPSAAKTFTVMANFTGPNGAYPLSTPVQGRDGNLYGTTYQGGASAGTIFKISVGGTLTTLYNFAGPDGIGPTAGLILATDGNFYGTTEYGGANGRGTVFKFTPTGTLTTLYSFCAQANCTDGFNPGRTLVQGTDGNFYGTTWAGGAHGGVSGTGIAGTVFKITPTGALTTLYSFCAQALCADGDGPSALVQATNGSFYGTTLFGGANGQNQNNAGVVFKITPAGTETTLYNFCSPPNATDGCGPSALIQAADGHLYGTTQTGGTNFYSGTVFKITLSGNLTTFNTQPPAPQAALVQATDGNFYGTGYGSEFKMTPSGTLTTLHVNSRANGRPIYEALLQATDGNFYGTASQGGLTQPFDGTVFKLALGLHPFVQTVPTRSKVGQTIQILGQGLTGTTGVFFNGSSASYTVVSDTYLKASVPNGATSGFVTVATPGGTLTSNTKFVIAP
jgi:uncharacterized repeat protein (TIGR03803 family)